MPRRLALALVLLLAACGTSATSPTDDDVVASAAPSIQTEPSSEAAVPSPSELGDGGTSLVTHSDALGAITINAPESWTVYEDSTDAGALLMLSENEEAFIDEGGATVYVGPDLTPPDGTDVERLQSLIGTLADISAREDINPVCGQRGSVSLGLGDGPVQQGLSHLADWGVADIWVECGDDGAGTIVELIGAPQSFEYAFYVQLTLPTAELAAELEAILSSLQVDPTAIP